MKFLIVRSRSIPLQRVLPMGLLCAAALLGTILLPGALEGQAAQPDVPRQMRHFWHVFIAYAVAWILLFGWIVAILRRLKRVEDRLAG